MRGLLRSNREVLILCVATALLTMGQGIAVPIVPLYADTLGVSVAQVGLVITAFGLARFLTNMPAAITSDRFGRRSILIGGALISALGNVMSGYATSLEPLLVYRFIAGIGSAAFITGAVIFIADVSNPTNRGRLMSLFQGSFLIGITAGPGMGGLLAEVFGLRGPFIAVGVVSLASAVWAFLQVPETRWRSRGDPAEVAPPTVALSEGLDDPRVAAQAKPPPMPPGRFRRYAFLKRKDFLLISMTFSGTFFTRGGAMFTILPLKASRDLGLSPGQIGGLLTIPSALTFVMLPVVGFLSDRFGRKSASSPGWASSPPRWWSWA
ncbi:MAG: MFS transporter [Chloroflexi bacterium]|nr:MFS transporter [Chloroflexota bacterium]